MQDIRSQSHGLCFKLTSSFSFHHRDRLILPLRVDGPGIIAYFHEPGAEFWIRMGMFMAGAEIESEEMGEEAGVCFLDLEVGASIKLLIRRERAHLKGKIPR